MPEQLKISVRNLVEFTLHGDDILPGGTLHDMQEGRIGHQARQQLLSGWQAEVPVSLTVPIEDEDAELTVQGRMDAFFEADPPTVEEIKLWQGREAPETAVPAHEAQALCYAHILCVQRELPEIIVRVSYVRRDGKPVAVFEQTRTAQECADCFYTLLENYIRRLRILRKHRRARNASLFALQFPFASYRPGQRELAAQVYTAIARKRRLYANMPTGTGKSAATLFPALKALGLELTGQVYYLTARTTQRQGPTEALARMRAQPLHLWTLTLDAKDKQCPARTLCHPDYCPRARGHYLRDAAAIEEMLQTDDWTPENIRRMADKHFLCPFEFSLSLVEVADLVICDYNYALDPAVHIKRIFDFTSDVTLLIDEAHNLNSRVRDMLGGTLDSARLKKLRTAVGKQAGRRSRLYKAMGAAVRSFDSLPESTEREEALPALPDEIRDAAEELADVLLSTRKDRELWAALGEELNELTLGLMGFVRALRREETAYVWIRQGLRSPKLTAFAPDIAAYLDTVTRKLAGTMFFSATLEPLDEMKRLLGGGEEDACFAVPSPYPPENLQVIRKRIDTRYANRETTVQALAEAIDAQCAARPGKYLAFFPSFAYLNMTAPLLQTPFKEQPREMTEEDCEAFLRPYREGNGPLLSLCVLGGRFAEGIDLPGDQLDGVIIIGVGLPTVDIFQKTLQAYYEQKLGQGFRYAYQIPGMQRVAQAGGRVIRSETDRGVILLLDDRYTRRDYINLLPPWWQIRDK